ncbi:MAG: DUF2848 family protein [Chloroflexi bacterium]|nr:DUF2848 family protein [Chloroflexota bacterium]
MILELTVDGKTPGRLSFPVKKMINAGFAARDQEAVRQHMEELRRQGVTVPTTTPTYYPVVADRITTASEIEVVGEHTSGEVEYVVLCAGDDIYVGVGSDHTDRKLEEHSILLSKQICPNVISPQVWPYREVEEGWDDFILRAWVVKEGKRTLYQEARLATLMRPEELLERVREVVDGGLEGAVIFSGTVPTLGGAAIFADRFQGELVDEAARRSLSCSYFVRPIRWFKGEV